MILQFVKYLGAAFIGLIADFGSLVIAKEVFNAHYLVAATIGFLVGLIVVYYASNAFVFGQSKIQSKKFEFALFALIGIVGLVLLNIIMWISTGLFEVNYLISKVGATAIIYCWNFFARRSLYHN
jgi:putative flippase GtrA